MHVVWFASASFHSQAVVETNQRQWFQIPNALSSTSGGIMYLIPVLVSVDGHSAGCKVKQYPGSSKGSRHSP